MKPDLFVKSLATIALENVFNPYRDICPIHDRADAATTRRRNLRSYLAAALECGVDTIWMGRDLGYRGGRRTGLALTDEYHLAELERRFPGSHLVRATRGTAVAERTAAEIWAALSRVKRLPVFWNVFPFHPHEPDNSFSNRRFTRAELSVVDDLNASLISGLGIKRIVSIGQDAAAYANRFGVNVAVVRHPSYGGVTDFRRGIAELYGFQHLLHGECVRQDSLFT
ncbi:uracil-DNA glycosylase [Burkholderia ubonensis]|uniref:uracil-DNA glycosylase n=1 Tax=Burkholderia ubonensis TaxID=101571 RepID=UPI0009B4C794|nr:uracil-DNA glycosylase [Burkholderia ubonensis]